jgi:hypothetical protein
LPTNAEQQVLAVLDQYQGNVQVAARELGTSESWVNRTKLAYWRPKDTALTVQVPAKELDAEESISALMPTNFSAIVKLRDTVIAKLQEVVDQTVDPAELIKLMNVTLKYERDVHKVTDPALGVFQDNRQIHIHTLVDKLTEMSPEALRTLTGVPEPLVIEVEAEELCNP